MIQTTTASFLAGATFELEFVGGFVHFKPTESSNESLKKFKVCGGATSVTASIQTTEVVLEDVNGKRITIIICDTPGFNDTKGPVMEISNGYGTIAAVQGASSIKPVVVINHRTMDSDRFAPLRQIVSNVIAMMGGDGSRSIDFSPFAYVFTHCEDRTKRHIAAQISFFLKTIHNDPNMKNMAMFPTLVAMLTDMISKTGPDDVICIDPEKPEEAPDILRKLWNGSTRIENPADTFVNFCSKESMSALIAQINIMIVRIENSFSGSNDLDCAETNLRKMVRLAEGLSLPEVDEAVKKGTIKAQQFVDALSTNIKNLPTHIDYRFEQTLDDMSSKLRLLAQTSGIRDICKMDFDYKLFVNGITEKLFSFTRQPIINLDQTIPGGENIIQQSIIRFGSTLQSFRDIMGDSEVEKEYSTMVKTMEDLMTPFISVLNKQLNENDPTSTELKENVSNLNFVLTMKGFFHSSKFAALELDITRWTSFETELKNILDNITDNSQSCVTHLTNLDNVLQEELLGLAAPWSCSSILKLDNIAEYKEYRDFLHVVSSSEHLVVCLLRDYSTLDIVNLIHDFDDTVTKYVEPNLVSFLEKSYLAVFENKSGEMNDRMNEAKNIIEYVNKMLVIAETLEELDPIKYRKVSSKMNCLNTKLAFFIEELKNNPIRRRSNLIPGKSLEPTENELRESKNKRHLRAWYSKCNELKAYRKKFGHCSVPSRYPKNKSLGQVSKATHILFQTYKNRIIIF